MPSLVDTSFLTYFKLVFYVFVGITSALIIISGAVYLINNFSVFKEEPKSEEADVDIKENTSKKTKTNKSK